MPATPVAQRPHRRSTRVAVAVVVLLTSVGVFAGCAGDTKTAAPASGSASRSMVDNPIDPAGVDRLADAIAARGLPVTNRHDVTGTTCKSAGCSSALGSDEITLLKFPSTGRAELYAGSQGAFQVIDLVMTVSDRVPADQKTRYRQALQAIIR